MPLGRGSAMRFSRGTSGKTFAIAGTSDALVRMSVCEAGTIDATLSTASTSSGLSVTRGSSCFGRPGVLSGQKREPTPPASTTTQMSDVLTMRPCWTPRRQCRRAPLPAHRAFSD